MPEFEKIEVAASLFVVIVGWFAQKWLDRRNNRLSRREEIRMKFLIESYSALNFFIHKGLEQRADGLKFQEVLNTIFLLGGRDLVNSVMAFQAYDHGEERPGGRVEIGTVLQQLRKQCERS